MTAHCSMAETKNHQKHGSRKMESGFSYCFGQDRSLDVYGGVADLARGKVEQRIIHSWSPGNWDRALFWDMGGEPGRRRTDLDQVLESDLVAGWKMSDSDGLHYYYEFPRCWSTNAS